LRERRLDVVLARAIEVWAKLEYKEDLNVEKLLDDRLLVVAGARSKWATRRKISLAELADAAWILPADSWNSLRLEEAFAAVGSKMPAAAIDTFSLSLRHEMLATGRFVAAIPATTLRGTLRSKFLKVLPVDLPNRPWPVAMITLKDRTLAPTAQHFLECARVVAKTLSSQSTGA
jgi:DNA-binding transcriptional LysR family regulator